MRILRLLLPLLALFKWSATTFAQDEGQYAFATRCIPAEGGRPSPESASYTAGTSVTVNCSLNSGFRFLQWEDEEGNVVSTSTRFRYTMPAQDVTLIARLEYDPTLPEEPSVPDIKTYATVHMDVSPSNGGSIRKYGDFVEIDGSEAKYVIGSTARLVANTNSGFRFVNWTENGEVISTSATLSFTVEEGSRNLVANFEYEPTTPSEPGTPVLYHKLTLVSNPEGAVSSMSGGGEYADGRSINVSATAKEYYVFENWTDDLGNIVSDVLNFSYTLPSRHVTLTANFRYEYSYDPATPDEPGSPGNDESGVTARPRISMYDDTHVMMLSSTPGATIYYTLDGTEPTTGSRVYSTPVFVPSNLLVKAIAVKDGLANSDVTTYQVTSYHAAAPVFTFKNYKVEISSTTPGAVIHYTIGRNDPTEDSPIYQEPIELNDGDLVQAIAYAENLTPSDVSTFVFQKSKYSVEAPAISLNENGRIEIVPAVEGSVIRFTTDGSTPDISSTVYGLPFTPDGNCTVKAYTTHPNYFDSPVGEYVVDIFKVERPEFRFSNRTLSMMVPTSGASIRYTVDGSIPTEESTLYNQPLNLTEDCRVIAKGFKNNYEPSDTISYIFVYASHQVAKPEVTYDLATKTVTMTCDTEDASIRYTTNGATPTATTGISYSVPFVVEGNKTFTVGAFRNDLFDSEVTTLTVDDQQVPTPTASFANRRLTLTCPDTEATIRYTIDGSQPTAESARYSGPVELTADCTVRFVAFREGFNDSEEGTFDFAIADYQVAQPVVTYDPDTRTVTMTCETEDGKIRYTTNGTIPTATTGTAYNGPFTAVGNNTYTVRAFRNDLFDSEVTTLTVDDQQVPTPTASFANKRLTLTCPDTEATIRYTLDGSQPTAESARYSGPVELTADCTVRFVAFREGFNDSEEGTFDFAIAYYQVAQPVVTYDPATKTITMTCETEDGKIRYSTNGVVPTATTGLAYNGPFTVEGNNTYTVRAFRNDLFDSEVTTFTVDDQKVPTPTASFANKQLTLSCSDAEATVY
ncbi:MAG: chitobiase/beta-hexosaminidase C-terminal domain-containing protein, partial [Muribaculaceae bacterium]|nr:chitobiase/beta-hexosaminidase C-terminal domain-containing protein [Muribaculaceae bacterium]